jgi:hypothetical protein
MEQSLIWNKPGPSEYLGIIDSILDSIGFHSDENTIEEIKKIKNILRSWRRCEMGRRKFRSFVLNVHYLKLAHCTEHTLGAYLNLYEAVHLGLKGSIRHCTNIAKQILEI